jgi:type VI secretion system protein ImpH
MAPKNRRKAITVENILSEGSEYSFIQAIRLLHLLSDRLKSQDPFDKIRVRPELSWSTPLSELVRIEKNKVPSSIFHLTATFLQLYGTGSPLPMFYTQELFTAQSKGISADREFIDIFNGILYEIHFSIWKKYQLSYRMFEAPDPALWEQLLCICGAGNSKYRKKQISAPMQISYGANSSRPIRTAEGMRVILSDLLGTIPVSIEQCVLRIASVPEAQRMCVGKISTVLGVDTIIGKTIRDRMGSIRIHIGPVSTDEFEKLLPLSEKMSIILEQIRLYIDQPLLWDIEITSLTNGMNTVKLGGEKKGLLGWNTWIYSGALEGKTVTARYNNKNRSQKSE